MPVVTLCKSISSFLTHQLPLAATDGEREEFFRLAMMEIAERVLPELNKQLEENGGNAPVVTAARQAVSDVVAIVAAGFVRTCSDPVLGASFLEGLTEQCTDPQLRERLAGFAGQLKRRVEAVAPKKLSAFRLVVESQGWPRLALGGLAAVSVVGWLMFSPEEPGVEAPSRVPVPAPVVSPVSLPTGAADAVVPPPVSAPHPAPHQQAPVVTPEKVMTQEKVAETTSGDFFRYTDDSGIIHMVDSREKVPQHYRAHVQVVKAKAYVPPETPVTVTPAGHVLVPVAISCQGRSGTVTLMIDTGATTTTITEEAAARIGLDAVSGKSRSARLADGRMVSGRQLTVDALSVGPKSVRNASVSILRHEGGREEHDGLLGMNFLKSFGHRIDFNRRVIIWDL